MREHAVRRAGFTLVETMIIVVILGLLIAAAIPNFASSNQHRRLEAAANEMATRLSIARARTIASRIPHRLVADTESELYWMERSENDSTWTRNPDREYPLPRGVDWSFLAGNDPANQDVEFESRGTVLDADAPLRVVFTTAQGDSFTLSLVRTGRVTVRAAGS